MLNALDEKIDVTFDGAAEPVMVTGVVPVLNALDEKIDVTFDGAADPVIVIVTGAEPVLNALDEKMDVTFDGAAEPVIVTGAEPVLNALDEKMDVTFEGAAELVIVTGTEPVDVKKDGSAEKLLEEPNTLVAKLLLSSGDEVPKEGARDTVVVGPSEEVTTMLLESPRGSTLIVWPQTLCSC